MVGTPMQKLCEKLNMYFFISTCANYPTWSSHYPNKLLTP